MARYIANQSGNWGTAGTWDTVANTPALIGTDQTITSTPQNSGAWTAPNLVNAITGCALYLTSKGTSNTITVTVQENLGAGFIDTLATRTLTLANVNTGWIYFKFAVPHTYGTLTASRYRIMTSADTGSLTVALAGTGLTHYMVTDDRHSVPGADNVFVLSHNEKSPITVTMNGTQTCGNTNVASSAERSITNGLIVGAAATLSFDTTASSQLSPTGPTYVSPEGEINIGSTGSPLSASYTAKLLQTGAAGNASLTVATGGKFIVQGAPKSSTSLWKGTLSSGVGTAASPAILNEPVNWSVGDEVVISANSANGTNYNETESRFIITKNSATSYVWSTTSGGAEAALTYTHAAGTLVTNIQRNIIIAGIGASNGQSFNFNSQPNQNNINIDWVRFEYIDPTLFFSVAPLGQIDIQDNVSIDYSVAYYSPVTLFRFNGKTTAQTHTGLVSYSPVAAVSANPAVAGGFVILNCQGQTLNDCYSLQNGRDGFAMNGSFTNTLNRCIAISSNTTNNIPTAGGLLSYSAGQNNYNDCEFHCNRGGAIRLNTSLGENFAGLLVGTKGVNGSSVLPISSTFNDVLFDSCTFGDSTVISSYLSQTIGSEIRFNRYQDTDMQHRWYTVYGSARSVGTGLVDTTVRTTGSYGVRIDPENATTGFTWEFFISAKSMSVTNFFGWFRKNTAFGTDDAIVELWLPGSTSADVSFTLTDSVEVWQSAVESVDYQQSIDGLATVKVIAKSTTPNAYLYCDDFYNAGDTVNTFDKMTGLDTWINGKPSPLLNPTVLQPIDFWNFPTANLNTPGTVGYVMKRVLTVAKFLGLK